MKTKSKESNHCLRAGRMRRIVPAPHEEQRVEAETKGVADELGCGLHAWSTTEGLTDVTGQSVTDCPDPLEILERIEGLPEKSTSFCATSTCFWRRETRS